MSFYKNIRGGFAAAALTVCGCSSFSLDPQTTIVIPEIPTLVPSVQPQALPAGMLVYEAGRDGQRKLFIEDGRLQSFAESWVAAARENLSRPVRIAFTAAEKPGYADWQEQRQRDYLARMIDLADRMPPECKGHLLSCPEGSYKQSVEALNRQYVASDALRLWQFQHIERAYVAALRDEKIRQAVYYWNTLMPMQQLEIGHRLVAYQAAAHGDVRQGRPLPRMAVEDSHGQFGGTTIYKDNLIIIDEDSMSTRRAFSIFWHEGYHIVEGWMRDMTDSKEGRDFLRQHDLLAAVEIDKKNEALYSTQIGIAHDSPAFTAYTDQAEEAGVRVDEAMGQALMDAMRSKPPSYQWTVQEAQVSFQLALEKITLAYTQKPYADGAALTDKLRYEDALHEVLLAQYTSGAPICYAARPAPEHCVEPPVLAANH